MDVGSSFLPRWAEPITGGRCPLAGLPARRREPERQAKLADRWGKTKNSGWNVDGDARLDLRGMNGQRAFHAGDIALGGYSLGDEALERLQVGRHAFQDEIHFTRQHVALAHFWPAAHPLLEMLEIGILLAGQADKDEAGDGIAQGLAVQVGVIAFDITG